jgi:hypothetical protein
MPNKWRKLHLKTIEALAIAIDAKDEVTPEHVIGYRFTPPVLLVYSD